MQCIRPVRVPRGFPKISPRSSLRKWLPAPTSYSYYHLLQSKSRYTSIYDNYISKTGIHQDPPRNAFWSFFKDLTTSKIINKSIGGNMFCIWLWLKNPLGQRKKTKPVVPFGVFFLTYSHIVSLSYPSIAFRLRQRPRPVLRPSLPAAVSVSLRDSLTASRQRGMSLGCLCDGFKPSGFFFGEETQRSVCVFFFFWGGKKPKVIELH